ncbi:interferon gamma receptor 1 [Garra rufa]|uniref:interferon gamma receptor 1 n=1 Tax=Garra rufa TaxID=137080 RepID=UPI003CCEE9DE
MRIHIYISVTVLIVFQKSASEAVSLPSPTNVSIHCDSYGVEVRWKYPDLSQGVQFQVEVKDDYNIRNSNITQKLRLNISSLMFTTQYNRYFVAVTAVRGGEESKPTLSDSFSYNILSTTNIKCFLDFPEIKLSPKDGKLHVQFANPLQLYRNSPALRDLTDNLKYCIETEEENNDTCKTCEMTHNTCEMSIEFSKHRGEYCISLTGEIGLRSFNDERSCFEGDIRSYPSVTEYVYPVLGVVLTLLFITGIIMLLVSKYNATIKKKASNIFPDSLKISLLPSPPPYSPDKEHVDSNVRVEPKMPPEEQHLKEICDNKTEYPDTKDPESSDSEAKNPYGGNDLVEDEPYNQSEGYDCPHAPRQEMSPGDMVDGYGPKLLLDV